MSEDITRLPKWAQKHIESLNYKLDRVTTQRDEALNMLTGGKQTSLFADEYNRPKIYLPEDSKICFKLDDKRSLEFNFRWGANDHFLDRSGVVCRSNWESLSLQPEASNSAFVSTVRRT